MLDTQAFWNFIICFHRPIRDTRHRPKEPVAPNRPMSTPLTTTPAALSSGQLRLREHVIAAAAAIDPGDFWDDPPTVELLGALRARALADPVIIGDAKIGRDLAVPSVPATYVRIQKLRFPRRSGSVGAGCG
jgi:hypothetical protein